MNIVEKWDTLTLILYLSMAILIALLFRFSIIAKIESKKIKIFNSHINQKYIYYFAIYLILIVFLVFRYVGIGVGGADAGNYIKFFNESKYVHFNIEKILLFKGDEYLFYNFSFLMHLISNNYRPFFFAIYSLIIISEIYVVDKELNDKNDWIFIIMFFLPILKSINLIRNCLAAAIGYIAIVKLNKNKYLTYFLISVVAYLNHYLSVILFAFLLFYHFFPKKILYNRKKLLITIISFDVFTMLLIPLAKWFLSISGFSKYLSRIKISLIGYIPYLIVFILLFLNFDNIIKFIKEKKHFIYYKSMIFIYLILPIFISINGANRILIFFEIPRYIFYIDLYSYYKRKIPNKYQKLVDVLMALLLISYLAFRIYRIWDGYGLMPYNNTLFG